MQCLSQRWVLEYSVAGSCRVFTLKLVLQESLSRVGIDPSAALARARSQSRGRKRVRSEGPDLEMGDAEQQKRLHSSKSRYLLLLKASDEMVLQLRSSIAYYVGLQRTWSYCLFYLFSKSCGGAAV